MQLDITKVKLRSRDIKRENAVNRKMIFIMFLAVDESLCTKGYGSAILKEIKIDILIRRLWFPLSHAMIVRQI